MGLSSFMSAAHTENEHNDMALWDKSKGILGMSYMDLGRK